MTIRQKQKVTSTTKEKKAPIIITGASFHISDQTPASFQKQNFTFDQ